MSTVSTTPSASPLHRGSVPGLLPLLGLTAWCVALFALRVLWSGQLTGAWLLANLVLAVVPLGAALWFRRSLAGGRLLLPAAAFATWLVFLPNAPYLVTDLMHLRTRPPIPLWFDVVCIAAFAGTGVLLGFTSLGLVQDAVGRRFGARAGRLVAAASLQLAALGVYFGRVLRWNSWEVATGPRRLVDDLLVLARDRGALLEAGAMTGVYGVTLSLAYVALCSLADRPARRNTPCASRCSPRP